MKNLRVNFERFCYKHRDKGIPNLMLYVCIGSAIVYLLSMINGGSILYEYLRFDKALILKGQVWRLVTYVFTYAPGYSLLTLLFLYFFYSLGRSIERSMGTFRFNLYYFAGVILMDVFAMIFCPTGTVMIGDQAVSPEYFSYYIYSNMAHYLHLSMLLVFATTYPDARFMILFIIPVKAWVLGLLYLVLIAIEIFNMTFPTLLFPHNLFPLVAVANYLLFMGKDILNLLPPSWRIKLAGSFRKKPKQPKKAGPIPFQAAGTPPREKVNYTHRCAVCGRTDVSDPELEFRYCSRCNGYFCYCEDHISNHTHVE